MIKGDFWIMKNCVICDKQMIQLEFDLLNGGTEFSIGCNYGSNWDTHRLKMAICDDCIKMKIESGQIIDQGSFLDTEEHKEHTRQMVEEMKKEGYFD